MGSEKMVKAWTDPWMNGGSLEVLATIFTVADLKNAANGWIWLRDYGGRTLALKAQEDDWQRWGLFYEIKEEDKTIASLCTQFLKASATRNGEMKNNQVLKGIPELQLLDSICLSGNGRSDWEGFPSLIGWGRGWPFPSLEYYGSSGDVQPYDQSKGTTERARRAIPID
ncbi:hypothetical protein Leryth_014487 [Lithospermum erythrorhizon]|nr:hypothetical protein Leryth_014487 [Lithospermum erythrorhizon]